jgi:hypothetical protein
MINNRLKMIELMILLFWLSNMTPGLLKTILNIVVFCLMFWNIGLRAGDFLAKLYFDSDHSK